MKRTILAFFTTWFIALGLTAKNSEYSFESYINQEYQVTDQSLLASTYHILASKPQTLEEGFEYLKSLRSGKEESLERSWVFLTMGRLLSAYPTNKYDTDIKAYVEDVESAYNHYSEIIDTYSALAKIGTEQTLKMLQERATYEFWEGKEMPSLTAAFSDRPNDPDTINAQSEAIVSLGSHSSPEAAKFLKKLQKDPRYINDPVLQEQNSIESALEATKWEEERRGEILEALALKESIFGQAEAKPQASKKLTTETIHNAKASNSSKTSHSPKSKSVTPVEESTEEVQAPRQWLWIVGAVLLIGIVVGLLKKK